MRSLSLACGVSHPAGKCSPPSDLISANRILLLAIHFSESQCESHSESKVFQSRSCACSNLWAAEPEWDFMETTVMAALITSLFILHHYILSVCFFIICLCQEEHKLPARQFFKSKNLTTPWINSGCSGINAKDWCQREASSAQEASSVSQVSPTPPQQHKRHKDD